MNIDEAINSLIEGAGEDPIGEAILSGIGDWLSYGLEAYIQGADTDDSESMLYSKRLYRALRPLAKSAKNTDLDAQMADLLTLIRTGR